ncbi:M15 family metallopeptidase [Bacillus rubiinfantis]|uniref:M15 family metallopeptidase n=1 Tax=Bacillus rubiinfantis TaxID=1499680 RepID=UPI0005A85D0E|nr:M15 family metallopeptidase [Bacillus rubiinfantis]
MKKRRKSRKIGSFFYLCLLLCFSILLLFQYLRDSGFLTESKKNQAVPYPTELHPIVAERSKQLIQQTAKKGIVVVITDGYRSAEDQDQLYAKGRTAPGEIVTYAKGGESFHNFGLAIDFALKTSAGKIIWDRQYDGNKNGKADWTEVVETAKGIGFEWGGDWPQFKDYPHLEMNFGLTIADLQSGERPPGSPMTADSDDGEK